MYYMAKKFICVQSEFKRRAMAAMAGYVCYEGEKIFCTGANAAA